MKCSANPQRLAKELDEHLSFWSNAPVAAYQSDDDPYGGRVYLEILVERYNDKCHKRLVNALADFCNSCYIVPQFTDCGWVAMMHKLIAHDLDRVEKGITFKPRGECEAEDLAMIHKAYSSNVKDYDGACCVRYSLNPVGTKYGSTLGDTKVRIIRFVAYEMCPLRIVLELYRLFDTKEAQKQLGCGETRVIGTNLPDKRQDPFICHGLLHSGFA